MIIFDEPMRFHLLGNFLAKSIFRLSVLIFPDGDFLFQFTNLYVFGGDLFGHPTFQFGDLTLLSSHSVFDFGELSIKGLVRFLKLFPVASA